ncbi:MAG: YdcF family protein [Candidatus Sungbacteria bacterium]|nr:YdcF family protein [Candidatus Sungbacteria bacterium]
MEFSEADRLAKILWDYSLMHQTLEKADCIFVLGNHDIRTADAGAEFFLQGWAPWLLLSGGTILNRPEIGVTWDKPEAEIFADRAIEKGVPRDKILIENKSLNTGENFEYSRKLLSERDLNFNKFILVQKPYMERRTWATGRKQWPDKELIVTSPKLSYEEYATPFPKELVINRIVGDFQRIRLYAEKGFLVEQEVPEYVEQAFKKLVAAGYNRRLVEA